ncbi:MAG: TetR/AcrR family transcriptional regulator, partial [Pseudomonadota bacterium]
TYSHHLATPETIILTLELTSESIRHAGIADLFMDSRGTLIDAMTGLLQRGEDEGTLRAMKSTTETAFLLLQVMEGAAFRHGIEGVPIAQVIENQLDFIQAALAAK